ncbi:MAG: hypothetical protein IJB09_04615 [Oscillospiraceae bacterium]|nr:hypothetical protein [Oscillospiraceae bacterium]
MTLGEAISRLDELKPNGFSRGQKIFWLSALDATVKKEIIDSHEGGGDMGFAPYDEGSADDTALLVPAPYDEVYLRYLEAQIDYSNGEYDRFNNSNAMYAAAYTAFSRAYNRSHMPIGGRKKYY